MAMCFSRAFTADVGSWLPWIGFCLRESDIIKGTSAVGFKCSHRYVLTSKVWFVSEDYWRCVFQVLSQRIGYLLLRNRLHLPRYNYMRGIGNSILRLRSNWNRVQCGSFLWWCFYTLIVELIVWRFSMLFPHTDGHIWQSNLRMEIELRGVF